MHSKRVLEFDEEDLLVRNYPQSDRGKSETLQPGHFLIPKAASKMDQVILATSDIMLAKCSSIMSIANTALCGDKFINLKVVGRISKAAARITSTFQSKFGL